MPHAHIHPCTHAPRTHAFTSCRRWRYMHASRAHIHIHTHTYIHTHTHTYIHTRTHTYIHACMHTHTYTHIHTYVHIHTYICMHPCIASVRSERERERQREEDRVEKLWRLRCWVLRNLQNPQTLPTSRRSRDSPSSSRMLPRSVPRQNAFFVLDRSADTAFRVSPRPGRQGALLAPGFPYILSYPSLETPTSLHRNFKTDRSFAEWVMDLVRCSRISLGFLIDLLCIAELSRISLGFLIDLRCVAELSRISVGSFVDLSCISNFFLSIHPSLQRGIPLFGL
jgi:hypothetical protein